jgi:hypothetical protein
VRYVMRSKNQLKTHANHFQERLVDRDAPLDALTHFDPDKWELVLLKFGLTPVSSSTPLGESRLRASCGGSWLACTTRLKQ